jgi:hypothetical protein
MFPLNVASPNSEPAWQLLAYWGALAIEIVPPTYLEVAGWNQRMLPVGESLKATYFVTTANSFTTASP